jgi:hypothetical protein
MEIASPSRSVWLLYDTFDMVYIYILYIYLTAIGLKPGGSSTAHIYAQTVHRLQRTEHT